ncbi:nucleoporin autopeptidase-domain-containing protein [Gautieria morchelliformis]|nr:nucleoporin autopeptidase-domain-containing protein [Gautieria morchelliformis]
MFGNLASTSNTGGGFGASRSVQPASSTALSIPSNATGAFGSASTSTGAFGQPKPAFGSSGGPSAFGSSQPSAFGNTGGGGAFGNTGGSSAFGASGSSGGAFGQPAAQQQQSAFGGGGGLFGKPQGSSFGSTALATTAGQATGSANPPYQEVQERDQTGSATTTLHYQAISCMPAYRNWSFEELRVQDYQQGRKTANSFGSSTSSAFGQPAQQQQASTGLFGQPAPATGGFGQQPSQPASGGFGAFAQAQPQQQSAFGAFGQPQQPSTGGFGAFGQQPQGQQQQQQPASGFSAFAQSNQQQQPQPATGFGAFGQQNKGFGAFAQPQPNPSPFSAFGSSTTTPAAGTSAFNQPQQNQSPFSAFGQQNTQANQQQGGNPLLKPSVFGQPSSTSGPFGNTGQQQQSGGLFGNSGQQQQQQQQQPQQSGGLFGNPSGGGAFGQATSQPQQSSVFGQPSGGGGGLFGNTNQQQQNPPQQNQQAPGSGFGSLFSKPPGGGLFGNTPTQQQNPNPSNPLFGGGGGGGGGLFGNSNTQQQQQQAPSTTNPLFGGGSGGSLFGGKPPAPAPGFGALGAGGLFGNTQQQQQQQPQGGLFGSTNTQPQQNQQPSLFGGSSSFLGASTQQQQPSLTASIDQPLPNTLPTSLPQLPSLASSVSPKKKSNVFADIAARSSPRLGMGVGLNYTPPGPGSKLRGFATSGSTATLTKNPFTLPPPGSPGKNGQAFNESKSLLPSDAFSSNSGGSLQLLGGARHSVKKLVLDKRVDEDELHRLRTAAGGSPSPSRAREVRFSPGLSVAAREKDNEPHRSASPAPPPTRVGPRPGTRLNDTPSVSSLGGKPTATGTEPSAPLDPQEGEYWCLPTVVELQRLSFNELQAVKDFTVGRVGFGTIQFLQPVDLTSVPSIADIPGKVVNFEHVECVLYPDERLKPPAGEGLNVPARIKLDRCWALDKSTRQPIKDPKDPKHLTRLRKMQDQEGAEFVGFDMGTGVWEFMVQEF